MVRGPALSFLRYYRQLCAEVAEGIAEGAPGTLPDAAQIALDVPRTPLEEPRLRAVLHRGLLCYALRSDRGEGKVAYVGRRSVGFSRGEGVGPPHHAGTGGSLADPNAVIVA